MNLAYSKTCANGRTVRCATGVNRDYFETPRPDGTKFVGAWSDLELIRTQQSGPDGHIYSYEDQPYIEGCRSAYETVVFRLTAGADSSS